VPKLEAFFSFKNKKQLGLAFSPCIIYLHTLFCPNIQASQKALVRLEGICDARLALGTAAQAHLFNGKSRDFRPGFPSQRLSSATRNLSFRVQHEMEVIYSLDHPCCILETPRGHHPSPGNIPLSSKILKKSLKWKVSEGE